MAWMDVPKWGIQNRRGKFEPSLAELMQRREPLKIMRLAMVSGTGHYHLWWDQYRSRHSHLSLRAESLACVRAACTNWQAIDQYLEDVLSKNLLKGKPT